MKKVNALIKLAAAIAAIAGIAYLVVKHIDTITEWLNKLCPCKAAAVEKVPAEEAVTEEAVEEAPAEEAVAEEAVEEAPVEEAVAEEAVEEAPVEEAPAGEAAPIPEGEPVAEESDFEA